MQAGLTFAELLRLSREAAGLNGKAIGDPAVLRFVLDDELRRGRVGYDEASGRYLLKGGLADDVRLALRDLDL